MEDASRQERIENLRRQNQPVTFRNIHADDLRVREGPRLPPSHSFRHRQRE